MTEQKTVKKKRTLSRKVKREPVSNERTSIEWGLYRTNGHNGIVTNDVSPLFEGKSFEDRNPVSALEDAFSSIAQVIEQLRLDRSSEVRISIKQKS